MSDLQYAEVIGDPIAQSKSPAIHNFWIGELGLQARYESCLVKPVDLPDYIAERRDDANWRGCNVTMPHKEAVIPLLDRLDPLAERLGSVNTVVREEDGSLSGYTTDPQGFLEPLRGELAKTHLFRMARVIGTGGAARSIIAALAEQNFTIVLAGRNQAKAQSLLDELAPSGKHYVTPLAHFATPTDFPFDDREGCLDLVVNASALGMVGQPPLAFHISHAPPGSIIYDIVTVPLMTPLLEAASREDFRFIDGLAMLIGQAAASFALFFGVAPSRADGDAALRKLLLR